MCGDPLGMDDIMLACVEFAAFFREGGGVTLLLAILTMQRKGSLVKGQPLPSHLPESQKLQAPLARSLPYSLVLMPLGVVGWPLLTSSHAIAILVLMRLPISLCSGQNGRCFPWGPSEQPGAHYPPITHLLNILHAARKTGQSQRALPNASPRSTIKKNSHMVGSLC